MASTRQDMRAPFLLLRLSLRFPTRNETVGNYALNCHYRAVKCKILIATSNDHLKDNMFISGRGYTFGDISETMIQLRKREFNLRPHYYELKLTGDYWKLQLEN